MAEGRRSLDRLQRKKDNYFCGCSSWLSFWGIWTTPRNVSRSSGNDGLNSMMSSNLACHSAGLSVHDILTDIETGFTCRPTLATSKHVCLLRSFLAQILIRKPLDLQISQTKRENHKNMTLEWEEDNCAERDQTTRWIGGPLFAFFCFSFFSLSDCCRHCAFDITFFFAFWKGGSARVGR
jgi:hypothetical protein